MYLLWMFLLMLFPIFIPIAAEIVGRLNDTFTFLGGTRAKKASFPRAEAPRGSETK